MSRKYKKSPPSQVGAFYGTFNSCLLWVVVYGQTKTGSRHTNHEEPVLRYCYAKP